MYRLYSVVRHRPPDGEEDAELFGASGVSAVEACTAAQVGRVHRHHRRDPGPARRAPPHRRGPRPARVPSPPRGHGAVRTSLLQTTLRRTCSSAVSSTGKEPMAPPPEHWISLRMLSVPFVRTRHPPLSRRLLGREAHVRQARPLAAGGAGAVAVRRSRAPAVMAGAAAGPRQRRPPCLAFLRSWQEGPPNLPNVGVARQRATRLKSCPSRIGAAGSTPGESRCAVRKGGVPMRLGRAWRSDREPAPWEGGVCVGRGGERRRTGSGSQGWTEWGCAFDRPLVSRTPTGSCIEAKQ